VDRSADRDQVLDKTATSAHDPETHLKGRGKTGEGAMVEREGERQGGEGQRRNPSSLTMALGSTHPLKEMSTRNLPGGKGRPACGPDDLIAICEPIV
jgi:hypothetical protein